jgi:hypothetical protein
MDDCILQNLLIIQKIKQNINEEVLQNIYIDSTWYLHVNLQSSMQFTATILTVLSYNAHYTCSTNIYKFI